MIFIKLMIEMADGLLKERRPLGELPSTLSELVTGYTEDLLRNEPDLEVAMEQARKAAHVCMGAERRPASRPGSWYNTAGLSKETLKKFLAAGLMARSGEKSEICTRSTRRAVGCKQSSYRHS
jgi:hypothetical protein